MMNRLSNMLLCLNCLHGDHAYYTIIYVNSAKQQRRIRAVLVHINARSLAIFQERSSQVSDASRRKEREMVKKEIDKLRGSIQTLTRAVNPLGKILDFVQEDLDSMQKELDVWKQENAQNQVALQREQRYYVLTCTSTW